MAITYGYRRAMTVLLTIVASISGVGVGMTTAQAAGATRYVAVNGSGAACTEAVPCASVDAAYRLAVPGDVIELAGGSYPKQSVAYRAAASDWANSVLVRPAAGAQVSLAGLSVDTPRVTVQDVTLTGWTNFTARADHTELLRVTLTSSLGLYGTSNFRLADSKVMPPCCNAVPIGIGGSNPGMPNNVAPRNILIENNELGPAYASPDFMTKGVHNETVHIMGGDGIVLRGNLIWEGGSSAALQIDNALAPLTNVLVENNYIVGCGARPVPAGAVCAAYHTIGAGSANGVDTIALRNNTIRGGVLLYRPGTVTYSGNLATGGITVCNPTTGTCAPATTDPCISKTKGFNDWTTAPAVGGLPWGVPSGSAAAGCGVQTAAVSSPAPVNPAPVNPAPVNPAPVNPAPVNPAPVNPAPVNPAPADIRPTLPPATNVKAPAPRSVPAAPSGASSVNGPAPTIAGPAVVAKGSRVTLVVRSKANMRVLVYARRAGSSTFRVIRNGITSSTGIYTTTYAADADYRYYTVSGNARTKSGLGLTRIR